LNARAHPSRALRTAVQLNAIIMLRTNRISLGSTAAIVTGMALIVGLDAVDASKKTMISALLIAALADNLTDSLSIHIYQESEHMAQREALRGTLSNFAARLGLGLSFAGLVALLPLPLAPAAALGWGMVLLAVLSWVLARERRVSPVPEVARHVVVAALVIFVSRVIGNWINTQLGS
jgi:VIT1/CCC1 family predicted Fe2+/Mn2+ transporter